MNKLILLPYEEVKPKIQEADLFLFRGQGIASGLIKRAYDGIHSHVGVASWVNGSQNPVPLLECIEFRAMSGGRSVNFENELRKYNGQIDVYRTTPYYNKFLYNEETKEIETKLMTFDGKAVTRTMRKMTGLPYGFKRGWWMAKHKLAVLRLFYKLDSLINDELNDVVYPVCSSAVAYSWNKIGFDLIPNRADEWSSPVDISRSGLVSYLFTPVL